MIVEIEGQKYNPEMELDKIEENYKDKCVLYANNGDGIDLEYAVHNVDTEDLITFITEASFFDEEGQNAILAYLELGYNIDGTTCDDALDAYVGKFDSDQQAGSFYLTHNILWEYDIADFIDAGDVGRIIGQQELDNYDEYYFKN